MKAKYILIFLCLCLLLSSCSRPRIDARDEESYLRTVQVMKESLSKAKREQLEEALTIIFEGERANVKKMGGTMGEFGTMLLLDEMTADDIISKANSYKKSN